MKTLSLLALLSLGFLSPGIAGQPALAQEADDTEPAGESQADDDATTSSEATDDDATEEAGVTATKRRVVSEEIVVTAQKREERQIDVPLSLATIGEETIASTGIRQVRELDKYVPNLQISQITDSSARINIRGVGSFSRNIGFDTRVGVYLDGVYLGQSPALNQDLLDLERVEVLRGPQGTLYGKNTVAGAINLVTKAPSRELDGSVSLEGGNLSSRQYSAQVSIPLVKDKWYSKFSASHFERDGYVTNLVTDRDINSQDTTSYRAQLEGLLSDRLTMRLSFDGSTGDRRPLLGVPLSDTFGARPVASADPLAVSFSREPTEDRDLFGTSLNFDYLTENGFLVKSITGYRDSELNYQNDTDYSPLDFVTIDYLDQYEQLSQEFQLISPGSESLQYVVGVFLYNQDSDTRRNAILGANIGLLGDPRLIAGNVIPNAGSVKTEVLAAFADGTYAFNDKAKIGLGLRLTNETKDARWRLDGSRSGAFNIGSANLTDEYDDTDLSPSLTFAYRFSPGVNGYLKAATGFKSGGFNLDFVTPSALLAGLQYDKETVLSYEAGLKTELFDSHLRLNLALFHSEYDDYQINQFVDLGGGTTAIAIRNAAEVTTEGLELEATWLDGSGLQVHAGLGLLDATFDSFPGGGAGGGNASGNELPYAPELTFSLGAEKVFQLPSIGHYLLLRGDYYYSDEQFTTVDNVTTQRLAAGASVPFGHLDAYDLWNARIGLLSRGGRWEVYLWGENLADEEYVVDSLRDFLGTIIQTPGLPRTYGLELVINF